MAQRSSSLKQKIKKDQVTGAQRDLLEQLFDDHYKYRWRVYQMNFFRGIFFGFGSVLGATVLVALTLWVLSFFAGLNVPVLSNLFEKSQTSIEDRTNR
jgi:hypothetical protein